MDLLQEPLDYNVAVWGSGPFAAIVYVAEQD